ncbi:cryptochrome/photolyase family protein [Rhodococcoides yunnanense]|jgi:deoxyribodipyrimidine photo-lyase|uniref:cryptochrome/photolyase family protein n=1 Tax=Rhodococcoides yunnanense TaxID=278209 RepID=UPI0022B1848D|nr:deoxyribodipyrimidine photo-lyase [Rhodococcus yunnanensis]MCZ4276413.1 deoxyribodipyrimidine photo-lyase [Rhodococcus yunnanensis]
MTVVWFRRDLRTGDLPTLTAAADGAGPVLGLFVLDEKLLKTSGGPRRDFLYRSLQALDDQLGGRLLVVKGDPEEVVPKVAQALDTAEVHVSADYGPYGRDRDERVGKHVDLVATGSPFAIAPGRVTKNDGDPYKVFTPYFRQWMEHGWRGPAATSADTVEWLDPSQVSGLPRRAAIPEEKDGATVEAGETAALANWKEFLERVSAYEDERNRPDLDSTSRMSVYLKYGNIHPRTMLADLGKLRGEGAAGYRKQLAWRDFYADILFQRPDSARENYDKKFDKIELDTSEHAYELFDIWKEGRTGFPIVDAGMRQLDSEKWMHNRVRMIVASFLVKDLHLPWWWGARYFMAQLVDGDLANNQHGWQWTAGTGTDASPYFRVFNPITQGEKFDPTGDYVRRWVPELRGEEGKSVHTLKFGRPKGYPEPIVDHKHEREVAIARFNSL